MSNTLQDFPPFYTLQQNFRLKEHYIQKWVDLIFAHCLRNQKYEVDSNLELLQNSKIQRKASPELIQAIFDRFKASQMGVVDGGKLKISLLSVGKGVQLIVEQLKINFVANDVITLEELQGLLASTPIRSAPESFIMDCLLEMQKQKLLALFGEGEDFGIKVF